MTIIYPRELIIQILDDKQSMPMSELLQPYRGKMLTSASYTRQKNKRMVYFWVNRKCVFDGQTRVQKYCVLLICKNQISLQT